MAIKNLLPFIGSVKTDHFLLTFKEFFFIIAYYRRINLLDFNRKKKKEKTHGIKLGRFLRCFLNFT